MSLLSKNISYLLDSKRMNAYQLQEKSGISQSTTFRIMNGDTKSPSSATVKRYADYFGVLESDLLFNDLSKIKPQDLCNSDIVMRPSDQSVRQVPVFDFTQAGHYCMYRDPTITSEFVSTHGDYGDNIFWVRVEGLGMLPTFKPGDMVLIDADAQPNAGDYVMATIKGQKDATLKKWRPCGFDDATSKEYWHLVSLNPDFPALDSRFVDFEICGVAIEQKIKLR